MRGFRPVTKKLEKSGELTAQHRYLTDQVPALLGEDRTAAAAATDLADDR